MPDAPRACNQHECDVYELHERRTAGETLFVLDVREEKELVIASLDGVEKLPMSVFESEWQACLAERKDHEIIVL